MKQKLLSENIISSLGRTLQAIYPEHFTESWLNKILRLLLDNLDSGNSLKRSRTDNIIIYPYKINLLSCSYRKKFPEFKNRLESEFSGDKYLIMLDFMPSDTGIGMDEISGNMDLLFECIECLVYFVKHGVTIIRLEKLLSDYTLKESGRSDLFIKLFTDIVQTINSSIFVISST